MVWSCAEAKAAGSSAGFGTAADVSPGQDEVCDSENHQPRLPVLSTLVIPGEINVL